jgi:hypothetical protein
MPAAEKHRGWVNQLDRLLKKTGSAQTATITPDLEHLLRSSNVNLGELERSEDTQLFQVGYVWEFTRGNNDPPIPQVRPYVLLNSAELEDILDVLERLVGSGDPLGKKDANQLIRQIAQKLAGDRGLTYENETISDIFHKINGLPFKSALLNQKPGRVLITERMERELKLKAMKLKDLRDGRRHTYEWEKESRRFTLKDPRIERRDFTIPGSAGKWYWVDLEEEIP